MPAPAWLSFLLWNVLLPDLLVYLRHKGFINAADDLAAKGALAIAKEVQSIKTYPEYPKQVKS